MASLLAPASLARADIANFNLYGKIYTKYLFQNNDRQGVLTLGNPFWPENLSGDNGIGSEFELGIEGRVSDVARASVRLQSRFGSLWQDWWENGNLRYDEPNTSGESLGMDHADYIKLRGFWVAVTPPIPTVRTVRAGASDLGQYNPWTIGKARYIDRDNGRGVFLDGEVGEDVLVSYHAGVIALPKLWVGPYWSTGIGDPALDGRTAFWSQDWAYAGKLRLDLRGDWTLETIATLTRDLEVDLLDPDAVGSPNASCRDALGHPIEGCVRDHAVDRETRYENLTATVQIRGNPADPLFLDLLGAWSRSRIHPAYAANGVEGNAGVYPLVYKDTGNDPSRDTAIRVRVEVVDPFDLGLSLQVEGFRIGEDYTAIFGARREEDVLLTDGFIEGGQLPTLNLANEFIDFDEAWYESCVGWMGGTGIVSYQAGGLSVKVEGTGLTYTTNAQDRDVDRTYPTFQHADGYTDTDLYDYANTYDRGRDPRSVFRRNQDRVTGIGVLRVEYQLPLGEGWDVEGKLKAILDRDGRDLDRTDDDYAGDIYQGRLSVKIPVLPWLATTLGGQVDRWFEKARSGDPNAGYRDYETSKERVFLALAAVYGGVSLGYRLEYLHKVQLRHSMDLDDQLWRVVRSKATLEAAW